MTHRKHSPLHDKWHKRVEGQIRDCMTSHPEWFTDSAKKNGMVNSLAKRIVGEIVVDAKLDDNAFSSDCTVEENSGKMD